MSKFLEIVIILAILSIVLASLKLAYGAGSLAELQSQMNNETGYISELVNYTKSHNITMDYDQELVGKIVGIDDFENMVKDHMEYCKDKPKGPIGGDPFFKYWTSNGDC
jgi:small nuclear ribonucleoprotein (snRNP)-like protein